MWFGYARAELFTTAQARDAVVRAMHEYASSFAFGAGQVVIEPTAPERILRAIIEEADRQDPAVAVMRRLEYVAAAWHLDLERLFNVDSPRTQSLWQVMEEIEGHRGGHLIVPSREHLTGLGPSGKAVTQRLTRMPQAHIYYLQTAADHRRKSLPKLESVLPEQPPVGERVLAESKVGAIPTVTRFDIIAELTRRDWTELIEPVDNLYMALADDANVAAKAAGELGISPFGHQGVIRLLQRDDGQLMVELQESRHRDDAPTAALTGLCAHIDRYTERGHTFTRCTLSPQPASPPIRPTEHSGRLS
ncbi:hypothetical protein [Nocardia gipuzkoensis]|uniref:hypothetical protein n=1 Tax=Nocardia gipuzkoensis TaxID=2749991 RepID=UPI0015EE722A|nr:hypothetical protein [Nocardia gipuzkoensis]